MCATHDLFLSYRWADAVAVTPLVSALEARGVRVWRDAREVENLASIQKTVATGLAETRALLAWYSGRYNESRACQWELTNAYTAAQSAGDPRLRILVVNPEASAAHIHLPEIFDQRHLSGVGVADDAAALHDLADRIEQALNQVPSTALGALRSITPPLWLPAMGTGSNRFVGRLREMWELHGALQANQAAMLTGSSGKPALVLIRGAGGIGKSMMAEEYALRFGASYPGGVFWLRAFGNPAGEQEIDAVQCLNLRDAQLLDIAALLGIDTSGLRPVQVQGALTYHFARQAKPFLWVVDDLPADPGPEGPSGWLAPHPLGCNLFTTRTRRLAHVAAVELPQLEADDAIRLLTRERTLSPLESITADAICNLLGHHALAVDVTAALVHRRGLTAVRDALDRPNHDALALAAQLDEALPNGHQRQIAATFLNSIRQLDEPARELLRYAAALAVAPIPTQLLVNSIGARSLTIGADDADLAAGTRDQVDLAISQLLSKSLADDASSDAINVHALVSRTVRFAQPSPEVWDMVRRRMVGVLNSELVKAADIRQQAQLTMWVAHARHLIQFNGDLPTADLLAWVALFDFNRANFALAREGLKREIELRKRLQGEEHPSTMIAMHSLAVTVREQGDFPGARHLLEPVLKARTHLLGEDHYDTLKSKSELALTLQRQGDLPGARHLQEAVLEATKRLLGEEHFETLTAANNLARTIHDQGDLAGAKRLQEAVLEATKRVLGEDDPTTLIVMSNLAGTLSDLGEFPSAGRLQGVAMEALRRLLGEEHPTTLATTFHLANLLSKQGNLSGAMRLHESVLEIRRRVQGEEHPDTLTSMNSLASAMQDGGDLPGARRLQELVLETRKRVLGGEHLDTLISMNDLAITMHHEGDLPAVRRLQEVVLEARRRIQGEAHPHTLTAISNLASTLSSQGDLPGARRLQEAVIEVQERVLGKEHPATLVSMNNLATTLWDQGDQLGASRLQEAVLKARQRVLGEDHPHTLMSMSDLASILFRQGKLVDAVRLREVVLEARKRVLGEEHPHTMTAMGDLALTLFKQGKLLGARQLQEAVLEGSKRVFGGEHRNTLISMNNLAITLWRQGNRVAARRLQSAATTGLVDAVGAAHPSTAEAQATLRRMQSGFFSRLAAFFGRSPL